jgi:hypothetical protein
MRKRPIKGKVFCIGLNKTGTTSWTQAMSDMGYMLGNERAAEVFFDDWVRNDYSRILHFCSSGEAFQDIPFSLSGIYRELYKAFPDGKFILTVRDSAEQWYRSVTRFHAKAWSPGGNCPPTPMDLKRTVYIYRGWPARFCRKVFKTSAEDPYNYESLLKFYERHLEDVTDYFSNKPGSFLMINVAEAGALKKMCGFIGVSYSGGEFPWRNRT